MPQPDSLTYEQALAQCHTMIVKGSKSFSMAARLFPADTRDSAFLLYGWCRYCDDAIDGAKGESKEALEAKLTELRRLTDSAYRGDAQSNPVFIAFKHLVERYAIPKHYPMELLNGMEMDIRNERYQSFDDLRVYCYRVAGTVGLMMSHVMGVSDDAALRHACDLGIAMQLTNIARDLREDAEMGRIYLPMTWLDDHGVRQEELFEPINRKRLAYFAKRLVDEAASYYRSGDLGLRYLSLRPAFSIAAARNIYSAIGKEVVHRGPHAWDERVWISKPRKVWLALLGVVRVLAGVPRRVISPWKPLPIASVWRHV